MPRTSQKVQALPVVAGSQTAAVQALVATLREQGKADEPQVAMALGLAMAVDAEPSNAALWRELRVAVESLREAGRDVDDDAAQFLDSVRTKVGDSPKS